MEKTISVIVPVYNVATYLPQCMESLLNQSYKALEIILIDDGSTDDSPALCDGYAKQDARVKVIHQKNGGAASAKNAGLRIATGEYLTFADSDDYVELDAYAFMVAALEEHGADVIQCSYRDIFTDSQIDRLASDELVKYSKIEYLRRYTQDWTCALLWDKLYKRFLFDDIFFEEGHIVDDEFFTYQGIMNAQTVIYLPRIVYNYRKRKSSVTGRLEYRQRTILDKLDYLQKRRKNVTDRFQELKPDYERHFVNMLLWLVCDPYSTEESVRQIKELVKSYLAGHKCCRWPLHIWRQLIQIRMRSIPKLLARKHEPEQVDELNHYFD